mmetsp:Transcript_121044/g.353737  ORF Transcript_121044/g.353737 Transcript_121044/m.353737 type:complete len:201 (+) Transcript_121044:91-693(+)
MARGTAGRHSALALVLLLALAACTLRPRSWCHWGWAPPQARAPLQAVVARRAEGDATIDKAGTTQLMSAAYSDDADMVRELIAGGADLNVQDNYGWTALRYAVRGDRRASAEALVELGADVNLASSSGRTPLMSAAGNNLSHMVRLLLKSGAEKEQKDGRGETAYDKALRGGHTGCTACREMLWFEGAKEHVVSEIRVPQ